MIFHIFSFQTGSKQMPFITEPGWRKLLCFCVPLSTNAISFLVVSVRDSCLRAMSCGVYKSGLDCGHVEAEGHSEI